MFVAVKGILNLEKVLKILFFGRRFFIWTEHFMTKQIHCSEFGSNSQLGQIRILLFVFVSWDSYLKKLETTQKRNETKHIEINNLIWFTQKKLNNNKYYQIKMIKLFWFRLEKTNQNQYLFGFFCFFMSYTENNKSKWLLSPIFDIIQHYLI